MNGAGRDSGLRRAVDVVVAGLALVVVLPLMAGIAVLVVLESRGSPLYRQRRVGRGGKPFEILKFRSMVRNAASLGPLVSGAHDPRVTRVGAVLRQTKLDELPQLVNVLRGDMTLVGPRAEVPRYVEHYTQAEWRTLDVRPGITGAGQVYFSAHQAEVLDEVADPDRWYVEHQLHPKLAYDLDYLQHRGVRADLGVLASTVSLLLPV